MGFTYGLLNTLNVVIAEVANMEFAQTLGLTCIYFGGGYFFGPLLVGEWILRHDEHHRLKRRSHTNDPDSIGGFKTTFIAGLLIYGTGTIMFWPSAVLSAFGGSWSAASSLALGSEFSRPRQIRSSLSAARTSTQRRDCSLRREYKGWGSVFSGLLADNVFFKSVSAQGGATNAATLLDVQWTYLAVTLLSVLLALFFYYMPLPEGRVTARWLASPRSCQLTRRSRSMAAYPLRTWAIIFAVAAQWFYAACQETMSIYFVRILNAFALNGPGFTSNQPPGMAISNTNYLTRRPHSIRHLPVRLRIPHAYLVVKHPNHRFIPTPRTMLTTATSLTSTFCPAHRCH